MSMRTTILWLLIAIALGAAALLLMRTPSLSGGTAGGGGGGGVEIGVPVLRFDPADLKGLRIEHTGNGAREEVERTADGWSMRVFVPGASPAIPPPAWPVPAVRIQSLTRLMLDARARAAAGKDERPGEGATVVTLTFQTAAPITVRLAERSIAGTAMIEVESAAADPAATGSPAVVRAKIDDQLHGLFRGAAPREWRDRTALPAAALDASRIRLTNGKGDIVALGRVQGVWSVREPFSGPADPAAVQHVLGLLGGITIADFLDGGAGAGGGAGGFAANATALIEHDRRELGGSGAAADAAARVITRTHTLEIGGPADPSQTRLFARIDKDRTIVIDARSVADLRLAAELYAWPHPTRLGPSEIGTIVLKRTANGGDGPAADDGGAMFRRELSNWVRRTAAGEAMLAGEEVKGVEALLTLLTGVKPGAAAGAVGPSEAEITAIEPRGYEPAGQVMLLSLAGSPLETIDAGRALAGKAVLRSGGVWRSYPMDRLPASLRALVEAPAVATPGEGAGAEIRNK
ncbi:MAG: hypothetical protein IT438_10075 [Phycisphaerales bacterium]|nr:hypothetical protein [Phycisphaerales bacterium]